MASYTYTGDATLQFPTLVLTVNPGDTFEAPADFTATDCAPSVKKPTPSAPSDTTAGA
jgi:hypothetical protein